MGLFDKIFKGKNNDKKQELKTEPEMELLDRVFINENNEMVVRYENDVAQSVTTGLCFEVLDVFTCGVGLFAVICSAGYKGKDIFLVEIINLDGKKLSDKVKKDYGLNGCLDDYCFLATPDIVATSKAQKRNQDGLSNADGLKSANIWKDVRTLEEIEDVLGCSVFEHPKAKSALFIHKLGIIESVCDS